MVGIKKNRKKKKQKKNIFIFLQKSYLYLKRVQKKVEQELLGNIFCVHIFV